MSACGHTLDLETQRDAAAERGEVDGALGVGGEFAGGGEALLNAPAVGDAGAQVPARCWRAGWWVHWLPAGTGENVVKYLARYVHRTAITDERILAADDEHVTFCYTDTATQTRKECTLTADDGARQRGEGEARSEAEGEANGCPHGGRGAEQFMRRYLQHVPPPGQHRVRYFGWMHPSAKARRLKVETLLAVVIVVRAKAAEPPPWHLCCRHCGEFALVKTGNLPRGPPCALRQSA